jgi:hypothetical protein
MAFLLEEYILTEGTLLGVDFSLYQVWNQSLLKLETT